MQNIYIIGTLHAGLTPKDELLNVLERLKPDQLLVEIAQPDLISNNLKAYPEEMIHAYHWANEKGINITGFDSRVNVFKPGKTNNDNQEVIEEARQLLGKLTWKDMNKKKYSQLLETNSLNQLINPQKENIRQKRMLKNINKVMQTNGNVVILTGTKQLDFLEKHFPEAFFPFR